MTDTKSILLVGVGGQGTILASKILSKGLISAGYDVKMSEIHGMSQRGGSVTTQVRYGKEVFSPIIRKGQADILVSFEVMEALRWISHLKVDGKAIINNYEIPSVPILIGEKDYPKNIIERIENKVDTVVIDAVRIAEELGNAKTMNIVLLGLLVKAMKLDDINWENIIRTTVKERFIDINIKALNEGMKLI